MEQIDAPIQSVAPPSHGRRWAFVIMALAVFGVALWWLFPVPVTAPVADRTKSGVSVTAVASAAEIPVGQRITVDILLDTVGFSVSAADVVVAYDATLLKAVTIKPGAFLPIELAGGSADAGRATMTVGSGTTPAIGSGVILTLTFEAIAQGEARIEPVAGTRVAAAGKPGDVVGALVPVSVIIR